MTSLLTDARPEAVGLKIGRPRTCCQRRLRDATF